MGFRTILGGCIAGLVLVGPTALFAQAAELAEADLKVGIYQNPPKVFIDEAGEPQGFWVDVLDEIARSEGWSLNYVPCEWDACLEAIEQGRLDLMVDVAYSEDRDRRFDFNQEVVLASWSVVYAARDVQIESILDLDQKSVAVLRDSIQADVLAERAKNFGIRPHLVEVSSFEEMFELMAQGRVAAGVVNRFYGDTVADRDGSSRTNVLINPVRVHFATADGQGAERLAAIDGQMQRLLENSNSAYYLAQQEWLEPTPKIGWQRIRHILIELGFYIPIIGLVWFVFGNRSLRREVRDRQQSETDLRLSKQRFRSAIDNAPFPIIIHAEGGEVIQINATWTDMTGYRSEEIPTIQAWIEKAYGEGRSPIQAQIDSLYDLKERIDEGEFAVTTRDGSQRIWQFSSAPLGTLPDGRRSVISVAVDVTERKQAELALEQKYQQEQSLNRVFQAIRNSLDLDTIFATATEETSRLLGNIDSIVVQYLPQQAMWRHVAEYRHDRHSPSTVGLEIPDQGNPFAAQLKQLQKVRVEAADQINDEINRAIAETIPGAWLLVPLAIEGQLWGSLTLNTPQLPYAWTEAQIRLVEAVGHQLEVAIQQAELYRQIEREKHKLVTSQAALTQAQQLVQMGNWELDVESLAMTWSDNLYHIFGFDPASPDPDLAFVMASHVHPEDRPRLEACLARAMTAGIPYEIDLRIYRADGSMGYMEARAEPIRNAQGKIVKVFGTSLDISDRHRTELALRESEVRYRKVVEAQTDFILRSRPDTTITFANPALCRALGVSLEDILGKKWGDFANAEDLEQEVFQKVADMNPENPRFFVENRDTRADGQEGWTQWLNEAIFDEAGQLVEIQSVGRDITDLKLAEQALRQSEESLRLVTENMGDLVCLHAPDGRYLYVTPSSRALLGYGPEELIGQDPREYCHPDDRELMAQGGYGQALAGDRTSITYRIRTKSGEYIWLETLSQPIFDQQGQVIHLQSTSREVSDRIRIEQQLKHDSLHDRLTGLPNRALLIERLDLALKRTKRHPDGQFAVMFLDLDNFKLVNDSLGHLTGDQLLMAVAQILKKAIRATDLAARLGGDEFVLLLEDILWASEAVEVAERILQTLRSPIQLANHEIFTGTSIGIVIGNAQYANAEELIRDSDLAMYRAKHSGRGQYALFDPEMHQRMVQRLQLENDLRRAVENQEFVIHYQPIVALRTGKLQGFEALLRWQHPQRGLVMPGEFIQTAEETGLIIPIGQWTLQTACQQLQRWRTEDFQPPLTISVNLSVKQLQGPILQHVETALRLSSLDSRCLTLEITESMLMGNTESVHRLLEQIKQLGVRLSIDDFGTGYSSLSYLHRLPVDYLKIDRAFVSPDKADSPNQTIAESIITLSNLLDLQVVAEGIETVEQHQWLTALGCELGQGILFGGAMAADQAIQFTASSVLPSP
ncbi:hypothetical protein C7271_08595 [filamentous cyanobacterium CCP5]|nr:hypothetical protein C7271_08595 [filamentous cyanobacterium CCP5]